MSHGDGRRHSRLANPVLPRLLRYGSLVAVRDPKDVTILIVDDDPDIRNLLMIDFRKKGFRVIEAEGGHAALDLVKSRKVDLVLSDIRMPEGDGIELLKETKALGARSPPVILVSAYSELTAKEARARGADAVFVKPFDRKELMSAILQSIENKGIA